MTAFIRLFFNRIRLSTKSNAFRKYTTTQPTSFSAFKAFSEDQSRFWGVLCTKTTLYSMFKRGHLVGRFVNVRDGKH